MPKPDQNPKPVTREAAFIDGKSYPVNREALDALVFQYWPEGVQAFQAYANQIDAETARLREELNAANARIAQDEIRVKAVIKRCDKYAIELHDLKNAKPSPGPMGVNSVEPKA